MPDFRSALGAFASVGTSTALGQLVGFARPRLRRPPGGPANLGDYTFAISALACVGLLAIRDIAVADPEQRREVATETALLLAALNGASLMVMLVAAPFIAPSPPAADLLRILAGVFLTNALLFESRCSGSDAFAGWRWVAWAARSSTPSSSFSCSVAAVAAPSPMRCSTCSATGSPGAASPCFVILSAAAILLLRDHPGWHAHGPQP